MHGPWETLVLQQKPPNRLTIQTKLAFGIFFKNSFLPYFKDYFDATVVVVVISIRGAQINIYLMAAVTV